MLGVTLLGTGSPMLQGVDRAGPSALITYQRTEDAPPKHYLVDAGRWVSQRLAQAGIPWPHLDAVLFTHHHMDHNIGWSDVLMTGWQMGRENRWRVYGPPFTQTFCDSMENAFVYDRDRRFSMGSEDGGRHDVTEMSSGGVVIDEDGLRVTCAVVPHGPCEPSFAYRFDASDRSIVISGDCRPSDALLQLADGCDVLVHEIEHRESLRRQLTAMGRDEARQEWIFANMSDLHTNETQLGDVATSIGARTLMLTHYVPGDFDPVALVKSIGAKYQGEIVVSDDLTSR